MKPTTEKSAEKSAGTKSEGTASEIGTGGDSFNNGGSQITELRRILVGSDEVSEVLPEAVSKSSSKNSDLSDATLPIVEHNIRESVIRNPRILADALFPVIGPAIRKAISAALSSMVQSFNQTLEHSVSPKGLRWRLEAMRTGRSFGEVVMLKTLRYSVEQVFLIHRETGLLLHHVARNPLDMEDADMVSAMLTAITDFAHDSFKTDEDATLDSFKISGLSVWIESGPDTILAAAIRGNPPLELRETFALAIEKIQFNFERELNAFDGDSEAFTNARPVLEECVQFQAREEKPKGLFSPTNIILGFLGLILLLIVAYFGWDYWRWSGLLESVRNEPGYILTDYQRGWFKHTVSGLRDPLAGNSSELLSKNSYDESDVLLSWREYQDSDPKFVVERAKKLLKPPAGVTLGFENGILTIGGTAPAGWLADAKRFGAVISGVNEVKVSNEGLGEVISGIEGSKVLFECGTMNFKPGSGPAVVNGNVEKLAGYGDFELEVTGFADKTGTAEQNEEFAGKRANLIGASIRKHLSENSLSSKVRISEKGSDSVADECKVTFKVTPQKQ